MGPGLEGVVAQHPPGGLRNRWPWPDPGEGAQLHPFGVKGCGIRAELGQQLLLLAVKPALTTGLLGWFVKAAVLVRHWAESGERGTLQAKGNGWGTRSGDVVCVARPPRFWC